MNLIDGWTYYKECQGSDWGFTEELERRASHMLGLLSAQGDLPDVAALKFAYDLLVGIEKWKAMCLKERMINAQQNSPQSVWAAFHGAFVAKSDRDVILAIMSLKGFGASVDEETGFRRAKVASSVLRFLLPNDWGVVDWRTIAMRTFLNTHRENVDLAVADAKTHKAQDLRDAYDLANEDAVCEEVRAYRRMRTNSPLTRAADIDMALFGLSQMVWPL
jgi:hypothetical protein